MDPTALDPTSGGATSPSEPETGRETTWTVLIHDPELKAWGEREEPVTAPTRREAERDALTIAPDGAIVAVVPLTSWKPVTAERPKDFRIVPADPWVDV